MRPPNPVQPTFGGGVPTGSQPAAGASQRPWWQDLLLGAGTAAVGAGAAYGLGRIPGLGGQVVQGPQMPSDIQGLRGDVISWLRGQGQTPNAGGIQPYGAVNQQGGFGGIGQAPIFSGGAGTPTYQSNSAVTGPVPVNSAADREFSAGGPPVGAQTNYGGPPGTNPTGVSGGAGSGYGQIFSQYTGPFNAATTNAAQVGPLPEQQHTTVGPVGQANFSPVAAGNAVGAGQYMDPRFSEIFNMISGLGAGMGGATAQATKVAPVADINSVQNMVQSIDQIVNSPAAGGYFKDNVLNPYRELFEQQRGLALAQARESSGNLTGSGYAGILGNTVNQLVPQEQARLADLLTNLATTEQQKQQLVAEREQGRNVQNQNTQLTTAVTDAQLGTQASLANASNQNQFNTARLGNQASMYNNFANIFGSQAQNQANAQNEIGMFNAGQANSVGSQQAMFNAQQLTQQALAQGQITANEAQSFFNAQLQQQNTNAQLQQNTNQFNAGQYNNAGMFNNSQQQGVNNQNAQAFLNLLLPMLTGGVTTGQQSYQPGAADMFGSMLPYFLQYFGNRAGANG